MLQTIDGREVYVVEFDTMPELPITFDKPEEEAYAGALEDAILTDTISEPGKYGIEIKPGTRPGLTTYTVFTIQE